jgi:hypothetical protein
MVSIDGLLGAGLDGLRGRQIADALAQIDAVNRLYAPRHRANVALLQGTGPRSKRRGIREVHGVRDN